MLLLYSHLFEKKTDPELCFSQVLYMKIAKLNILRLLNVTSKRDSQVSNFFTIRNFQQNFSSVNKLFLIREKFFCPVIISELYYRVQGKKTSRLTSLTAGKHAEIKRMYCPDVRKGAYELRFTCHSEKFLKSVK